MQLKLFIFKPVCSRSLRGIASEGTKRREKQREFDCSETERNRKVRRILLKSEKLKFFDFSIFLSISPFAKGEEEIRYKNYMCPTIEYPRGEIIKEIPIFLFALDDFKSFIAAVQYRCQIPNKIPEK